MFCRIRANVKTEYFLMYCRSVKCRLCFIMKCKCEAVACRLESQCLLLHAVPEENTHIDTHMTVDGFFYV